MCRNIKPLFNFEPPATKAEIKDASEQFVRKISGFGKPSEVTQVAVDRAVDEVSRAIDKLLGALKTTTPPRNREVEAEKAHKRALKRFG